MEKTDTLRTFNEAVAVVTGGASGIGRALSEDLARRGAHVVIADRQIELAKEVFEGINTGWGTANAIELDVTDFAAVERVVQETVQTHGRLDYIFNNAGLAVGGEVSLYQPDDWRRVLDVNLQGVVNGVQAAYPVMLKQGYGHIVNTASMAGLCPFPMGVSYAATKHAVLGLSTSLRIEAADAGVRVSVFCPGFIRTQIMYGGGKYGKDLMQVSSETQEKMIQKLNPMDPADFSLHALNAVARNTAIIIVPARWKLFWWLNRLSPSLVLWLSRRVYKSTKKTLEG
jgi:NAD(P)-dependent dehydrogenase (short-subunit alcohol dehydrogenase family)